MALTYDSKPITHYVNEEETALQKDPNGKSQHEEGSKLDDGKVPIDSLLFDYFPMALMGIAMVSEYGARKYTPKGWETVPKGKSRYTDAMARHLIKEKKQQYDDGDSGLAEVLQTAWNALARAELMLQDGDIEIRRGNDIDENGKPILGTARKIEIK